MDIISTLLSTNHTNNRNNHLEQRERMVLLDQINTTTPKQAKRRRQSNTKKNNKKKYQKVDYHSQQRHDLAFAKLPSAPSVKYKDPVTGKVKYPCPLCDRVSSNSSNYYRHIRIHEGIRPHKCRKCQRGFIHTANLKKHEAKCGLE
eukprot:m.152670 g.152670  ORF g.152670 m.152670 type:complete len:146 (+) comp24556_c1_seq1:2950-3387(+)